MVADPIITLSYLIKGTWPLYPIYHIIKFHIWIISKKARTMNINKVIIMVAFLLIPTIGSINQASKDKSREYIIETIVLLTMSAKVADWKRFFST